MREGCDFLTGFVLSCWQKVHGFKFFYANRVKSNLFFLNYTAKKLHCKSWRNYLSTGAGFLPSTACPFLVGWFAIYIHHFETAAYFA